LTLQVDETIVDMAFAISGINNNNFCNTSRPGAAGWIGEPGDHLSLARLLERYDVEVDCIAMLFAHNRGSEANFLSAERVEGMGD
jgi:hypothetical protein